MSWVRTSDKAANHPRMLRALEHPKADPRSLNELWGFIGRCATESSAHRNDYTVMRSQAIALAGGMSEADRLIELAVFCGLFTETEVERDGLKSKAYVIHQDMELFHIKLAAEQDWENQRKRDVRDPEVTGPARLRDGDACRYCGKTVNWKDRTSNRAATYDHTVPGQPGNVVISCKGCNSKRKDDPDKTWTLLPAPARPLYGPETVKFLAELGHKVTPSYQDPSTVTPPTDHQDDAPSAADGPQHSRKTPAVETPQQGTAPAMTSAHVAAGPGAQESAADDQQQVETPTDEHAPTAAAGGERPSPRPSSDLGQVAPGPGFVGSGRDGLGRDGSGKALAGLGLDGSGRAGPGLDRGGGRAGSGGSRGGAQGKKRKRGRRGGKR